MQGKDYSYNPIAFPPSMEVRFTNAAGAGCGGAATDKNGNTQTERYDYPEAGQGNRLLSRSLEGEGRGEGEQQELTYNEAGSPTEIDGLSYEYNANQRPVKVSKHGQLIAEYQYNRFGERIKKVVYANTKKPKVTYYLYDGHSLTAEANEQGKITAQYLYHKGHQPISKLERKDIYAIHSDHLGTPRVVTNDKGETVWQADYSPFGQAEIKTQRITLNLRLPGQYEDQETGTYYNYLRDYNPKTGRYTTSDPIGLKGGLNTYAYVKNDPLGLSDVLGMAPSDTNLSDPPAVIKPAAQDQPAIDLAAVQTVQQANQGELNPANEVASENQTPIDCTEESNPLAGYLGQYLLFQWEVGKQAYGLVKGFVSAAGELVLFAADVAEYSTNLSLTGLAVDYIFDKPPSWLPSFEEGLQTTENIVALAEAIKENPSLMWEAIKEPYVQAWAEGRYGEAIGRGIFDFGSLVIPAGMVAKIGKAGQFADIMRVLKRAEAVSPDELANGIKQLVKQSRTEGKLGELVDGARQSDTLDDLLKHGDLTPDELESLKNQGKLTPEEVQGTQGIATNQQVANHFQQNRRYWSDDPVNFNGNKVYQRNDLFDPNQMTTWKENGQVVRGTNLERMATGRAPVGTDGNPVNLHHLTQTQNGAIAEMSQTFHQQNYGTIHINTGTLPSGINRVEFDAWRAGYWRNRVLTME